MQGSYVSNAHKRKISKTSKKSASKLFSTEIREVSSVLFNVRSVASWLILQWTKPNSLMSHRRSHSRMVSATSAPADNPSTTNLSRRNQWRDNLANSAPNVSAAVAAAVEDFSASRPSQAAERAGKRGRPKSSGRQATTNNQSEAGTSAKKRGRPQSSTSKAVNKAKAAASAVSADQAGTSTGKQGRSKSPGRKTAAADDISAGGPSAIERTPGGQLPAPDVSPSGMRSRPKSVSNRTPTPGPSSSRTPTPGPSSSSSRAPKRRRMRIEKKLPSGLVSLVESSEAAVGSRLEAVSLGSANLRELARDAARLLHSRYRVRDPATVSVALTFMATDLGLTGQGSLLIRLGLSVTGVVRSLWSFRDMLLSEQPCSEVELATLVASADVLCVEAKIALLAWMLIVASWVSQRNIPEVINYLFISIRGVIKTSFPVRPC